MRGKIVTFAMLVVSFLGGSLLMYYLLENNESKTQLISNQDSKTGIVKCSNEIKIDETGISTAVGEIYDATVTIQNYQNEKLDSSGSGFVYKIDDKYGYILTNHHVVADSEKLVITMANDNIVEG